MIRIKEGHCTDRRRHIGFCEYSNMCFGPGKRKGYTSFKVVDRSNKSQKAIAKLPSTLPLEQEQGSH